MNSFMGFATEKRKQLRKENPKMHNKEISKLLGVEWKALSVDEKAPYIKESKRLRTEYEKATPAE